MSARTSTFIFTLLLAYAWGSYEFKKTPQTLEKAVYPSNVTNFETLREFVKLVEKNNLNVSLIISQAKNYEDDNLKEAMALTLTFPVNADSVTKPTIEKEDFEKLVKVANKEHVTVGSSVSVNNKLKVKTNYKQGLPITKAYKIFTGIKNGKTGFVFDEENYVAQYTFVSPGADGKNQTTRVFHGDIDVEVVEKSESLDEDELNIIKKAVVDAMFTVDEENIPKGIVALLDEQLSDRSWNAATQVRDPNYVNADIWALFYIQKDYYIVYAS